MHIPDGGPEKSGNLPWNRILDLGASTKLCKIDICVASVVAAVFVLSHFFSQNPYLEW